MDWCKASQSWNIRFDELIKAYGFTQTFEEACIYKKVSGSSIAFLILYVHDILYIGNDIEILDSMKGYLKKSFSKQDLGEAAYTLSIKIYICVPACVRCPLLLLACHLVVYPPRRPLSFLTAGALRPPRQIRAVAFSLGSSLFGDCRRICLRY